MPTRFTPGGAGSRLAPTGDPITDCEVTTSGLADSSVTGIKIADCSIDSNDISDSTNFAPADCSIDSTKLQDCAVSSAGIQDSAVDSGDILDCAVTTQNIKDSAVDSTLVADSAVDSGAISDSAVSTQNIANDAVDSSKVADSAVDSGAISDSAVSSANIQDGAIVASDFYDTTLPTRVMQIHATDTTLAVGDTLATFFIPAELNGYDIVRAEACVKVISTSGRPTIQLRNVTIAADVLTNKITLDSGEKTSYTSDTASSVNTSNDSVATGDEIAIDVDSAGTGTEDLYVIVSFRKP